VYNCAQVRFLALFVKAPRFADKDKALKDCLRVRRGHGKEKRKVCGAGERRDIGKSALNTVGEKMKTEKSPIITYAKIRELMNSVLFTKHGTYICRQLLKWLRN